MPTYVDENIIAERYGISVHKLRRDRRRNEGLPFFRIGRSVRYDIEQCEKHLKEHCNYGGVYSHAKN